MSERKKTIQYVLFVLMVCSLLAAPVAAETLGDPGANPGESAVNGVLVAGETPAETPSPTPTEEPTAASTENPGGQPVGTLSESPVILFNGTVVLTVGTFECTAYNSGASYTVNNLTPLGSLQAVAEREGFTLSLPLWVPSPTEIVR